MKSFKQIVSEMYTISEERVTITKEGHPLKGHNGEVIGRHLDGSVDVRIRRNGETTVVRLPLKHVASRTDMHEEAESIDEVLTKDTDAGEVIKDFEKSDAPQFKGKSQSKRKQMAIAAYLELQRKNK